MATVAGHGPFPAVPEIDRVLMVFAGGGPGLNLPGGDRRPRPGLVAAFASETPVHAGLPAGPIEDLNRMVRRDRYSGRTKPHRLAIGATPVPDGSVRAVVVQDELAPFPRTSISRRTPADGCFRDAGTRDVRAG
jgi:environmental stress-induced protein Ves